MPFSPTHCTHGEQMTLAVFAATFYTFRVIIASELLSLSLSKALFQDPAATEANRLTSLMVSSYKKTTLPSKAKPPFLVHSLNLEVAMWPSQGQTTILGEKQAACLPLFQAHLLCSPPPVPGWEISAVGSVPRNDSLSQCFHNVEKKVTQKLLLNK